MLARIVHALVALALAAPAARAAEPPAPTGIARFTRFPRFVEAKISPKGTYLAAISQQDKMRQCAKQATGKKGAERKAFMKGCLSKKKT